VRSSALVDLVATTRRPRRYLLVGLTCATLHNGFMFASNGLGMPYVPALALSFLLQAPTGYTLHSLFTFERSLTPGGLLRFTAGLLTGFWINLALMVMLVSGTGMKVPVATVLCTGIMFVWNYLSARWAIAVQTATR